MREIDIATIQALIQMASRLATPAETLWLNDLHASIQEAINGQSVEQPELKKNRKETT